MGSDSLKQEWLWFDRASDNQEQASLLSSSPLPLLHLWFNDSTLLPPAFVCPYPCDVGSSFRTESPSAPSSPPLGWWSHESAGVYPAAPCRRTHCFPFISLLGSSPGHSQACYDRTIHAKPRTDVKDLLEPGKNFFSFKSLLDLLVSGWPLQPSLTGRWRETSRLLVLISWLEPLGHEEILEWQRWCHECRRHFLPQPACIFYSCGERDDSLSVWVACCVFGPTTWISSARSEP